MPTALSRRLHGDRALVSDVVVIELPPDERIVKGIVGRPWVGGQEHSFAERSRSKARVVL